jgi:hypothetical protein
VVEAAQAVEEESVIHFPTITPGLLLFQEATEMAKAGAVKATGRSVVAGTNDMNQVEPFLQKAAASAENYREKATALVITSHEEAEAAGVLGREIAELVESMERQRREFVDPLNAHVKKINGQFKASTEPLGAVVRIVKDKIGGYYAEQKRIADEKTRRANIEQEIASAVNVYSLTSRFEVQAAEWERKAKAKTASEWEVATLDKYRERLKVLKSYEKKVERAADTGKAAPPPPKAAPAAPVAARSCCWTRRRSGRTLPTVTAARSRPKSPA